MQGSTTFRAALLFAVVATGVPGVAHADAPDDARAAYDRGTAAHARGDYRAAASEMARADALAPNVVALKAALDEALLADDAELGMQLVERAKARARGDASIAPSVRQAISKFAGRTGRVKIDCGGRPCRATIDARPMDLAAPAIVLVGPHRVTIDADGATVAKAVTVAGDQELDVLLPPLPPPPPPAAASPPVASPPPLSPVVTTAPTEAPPRGLSPLWFAGAAALTAVAGAFTIASGIDTANQHSTFTSLDCSDGRSAQCPGLATNGNNAQTRTNILAATTGALGAATIAITFFVAWRSPHEEPVALVLGDRAAALRVRF